MPTILLAIDACTRLDRLLSAAVLLASQRRASLLGVFAQDIGLQLGAALPFTFEIGANSAVCYPLTSESIGKRVQSIAENMRRQLSSAAERHQLSWEFQICNGSISRITTEATAEIVLPGWSSNLPAATMPGSGLTRKTPGKALIAVIDDASPSSVAAIDEGRRVAGASERHQLLTLDLSMRSEVSQLKPTTDVHSPSGNVVIPVASSEQLIRQIRRLRPVLTLLGSSQDIAADSQFQKELAFVGCPLALIRSPR